MRNLIVTALILSVCVLATTVAFARPMPLRMTSDDGPTEDTTRPCITGEFIFAKEGIEMVGCTADQSRFLSLKQQATRLPLPIRHKLLLFYLQIKDPKNPKICSIGKVGDDTAECSALVPVIHKVAGHKVIIPTMDGKFVSGRVLSAFPEDEQLSQKGQ